MAEISKCDGRVLAKLESWLVSGNGKSDLVTNLQILRQGIENIGQRGGYKFVSIVVLCVIVMINVDSMALGFCKYRR